MPELLLTRGDTAPGVQVLALEPPAMRSIGIACLDQNSLSPRRAGICTAGPQFRRNLADFLFSNHEKTGIMIY